MPLASFPMKKWLEGHFKTSDAIGADSNDVTSWQFIRSRLAGISDATFTPVSKTSVMQQVRYSTSLAISRSAVAVME
jgi:hypothetical protein